MGKKEEKGEGFSSISPSATNWAFLDEEEEEDDDCSFLRGGEDWGSEEEAEADTFFAEADAVALGGPSDTPYFLGLPLFLRTVSGGAEAATGALLLTVCGEKPIGVPSEAA